MKRRMLLLLAAGMLGLGLWLSAPAKVQAQDYNMNRFFYYPYYYFPHNYWPNYQRWPDPRQPFQKAPTWMAYPPYLDQQFTYPLFENKRYYHGNHFFLDQF